MSPASGSAACWKARRWPTASRPTNSTVRRTDRSLRPGLSLLSGLFVRSLWLEPLHDDVADHGRGALIAGNAEDDGRGLLRAEHRYAGGYPLTGLAIGSDLGCCSLQHRVVGQVTAQA